MASDDITDLINLDPCQLTLNDPRLHELIHYYRQARARSEAGMKPQKAAVPKISLDSVRASLVKVEEKPKFRRI